MTKTMPHRRMMSIVLSVTALAIAFYVVRVMQTGSRSTRNGSTLSTDGRNIKTDSGLATQPPRVSYAGSTPRTGEVITPAPAAAAPAARSRIAEAFGRLPLRFEQIDGTADGSAFLARGPGYCLWLTAGESVYELSAPPKKRMRTPEARGQRQAPELARMAAMHLRLLRANKAAQASAEQVLTGETNYLIGKDPDKWRRHVRTYGRVRFNGVYPGVDLAYYGNQRQLEYDFIVAPGADPGAIELGVDGVGDVSLDASGNLLLRTSAGTLVHNNPVAYQEIDGRREAVPASFRLDTRGGKVRFALGSYDRSRPLVIDPSIVYSRYLGGSSFDGGAGIAVDGSGNIYVVGSTNSTNFPLQNPFQGAYAGLGDAFVAKLAPDGASLLYCTYLGGSVTEWPSAIAVDGSGNACVTGETSSADFPVSPFAYQPLKGPSNQAFVTKLDATGSGLVFSTYLGPPGLRVAGFGIAVGSDLGTYVTGYNSGGQAFVTKFDPAGGLAYNYSLGGNGSSDIAYAIAVDSTGNAYVTGETDSTNFPTVNPFQSAHSTGYYDAFVTKVNATGTALLYSTYLGGANPPFPDSGSTGGFGIAVDSSGSAIVTGTTDRSMHPVLNAAQPTYGGGSDAFVTKFSPAGNALIYSTYLGGGSGESGKGIAVDSSGNAFVTGSTDSANFPTLDSLEPFISGTYAFVTMFDPAGLQVYSTLLRSSIGGGTIIDAVACDDSGNAYVTGSSGSGDAFITKISPIIDANSPPVANDQSVTTDEDAAKSVTLVASDPDADPLAYSVVTGPTHGTLTGGNSPNRTYTPNPNYNGPDSFTFKANDGALDSNTATVSITVTPVNDAPVAAAQAVVTKEDTAVAIALVATDIDLDALTYSIVSGPSHGTLSGGNSPNRTYTPDPNYNGLDSFTFKANDGSLDSNTATVSITVTPVNDAPVASAQAVTTNEDTAKSVTLVATDVDGDALTYSVITGPGHGTLSGAAPNLTYTPGGNYNGADGFTFKANDGALDSNTATVSITVTPVNDAPVAAAQAVTTNEDTAKAVTLVATDVDGDPLTYSVITGPVHGTLSGAAPNLTYTPVGNYNGVDGFTFKANDGAFDSNTAPVSITVTPVNHAPVAVNDIVTTSKGNAVTIDVTANDTDVDGDPLTVTAVIKPAHGKVVINANSTITYSPTGSYTGPDSFTYSISDGNGGTATATVSINVIVGNAPPRAVSDRAVTGPATPITIAVLANDSDPDGDPLSIASITQGANGVVVNNGDGTVTYTPAPGFSGHDTFTYVVSDGNGGTDVGTVRIRVTR